jgi:nucleotide-binding universal stress UspA family protein
MDFWTALLGVLVVAVAFVLVPVGASAFMTWRRPVRLTCPQLRTEAQVTVSPLAALVASWCGGEGAVERCSVSRAVPDCRDECLALPEAARRPVPAGTPPPRPDRGPGVHTIVVPLDGHAGSEAVLPAIAELARAHGASVRLLRVLPTAETVLAANGRYVVAFADQELARREHVCRDYMRDVARRLPGIAVSYVVRVGDPVTSIVEEAEVVGADFIALASHRRGVLARLARGSVARRLRRATLIPTLVVPYGAAA